MMSRAHGFTLLEVLLYLAISSTILLASASLFSYTNVARAKALTIQEVDRQADYVSRKISQTLRNSYVVHYPLYRDTGAFLSLGSYTQANNPTYFRLTTGAITMQEGPSGIVYPITSPDVTVSAFSATTTSSLSSPGSVRVVFTLDYNGGPSAAYKYQKTYRFSASVRQP